MESRFEMLGVALLFAAVMEAYAAHLMIPAVFKWAIPVARRRFPAPTGIHYLASAESSGVCLSHVGGDEWIFRHAGGWFSRAVPLFRGSAQLEERELVMTGRVSPVWVALCAAIPWLGDRSLLTLGVTAIAVAWILDYVRFALDCSSAAKALLPRVVGSAG